MDPHAEVFDEYGILKKPCCIPFALKSIVDVVGLFVINFLPY
jgi:hypothetical protein